MVRAHRFGDCWEDFFSVECWDIIFAISAPIFFVEKLGDLGIRVVGHFEGEKFVVNGRKFCEVAVVEKYSEEVA